MDKYFKKSILFSAAVLLTFAAGCGDPDPAELMAEAGVPETAAGTSAEEKEDSPKLGDPGVCPDCGATDQTGKFCEYCGAKLG